METPEEIRFGTQHTISMAEYRDEPGRFNHMIETRMREELAHFIQNAKVETTETEYMIEKRLELYAATPDVFWEIVHKEAEKIAQRYMNR